jgi:hypothetical protein
MAGGIALKPWHLYPVNARDGDRSENLIIRPVLTRPWLASFVGAHMQHYITEVRLRLQALKNVHRFHIEIKDEWHFNEVVYRDQVGDGLYDERQRQDRHLKEYQSYNRILSDSVFSLCPGGAGPNSLRLWESFSVGAIPVILSDSLCLPDIAQISGGAFSDWTELVIFHPEAEVESLPKTLREVPTETIKRMSDNGRALIKAVNGFTCIGRHVERPLISLPGQPEQDTRKPTIVIPEYGAQDTWYWRRSKLGFYSIVMEWYLRGYVNITFGERGYFWWGAPGSVLLMERDNVTSLLDGKLDPPRWSGEVPYQHAFFFNQYHLGNSRNHKATYFACEPALLERTRASLGRRSYATRTIKTFFAGSIENETQEFFRNRFKAWDSAIEIFACADKLNAKETHRFTPAEYLEKVSCSKFGVCFSGNGPKCFREIEYLALGTPLIITDRVEVNYPEPLVEGIHYVHASSPSDIDRILSATTPDRWEAMSRACWEWFDRNASIDSSFNALARQIGQLNMAITRHNKVLIRAPRTIAAASLAVRSLAIADPTATWVSSEDRSQAMLSVEPDDLIINELPPMGGENEYNWRVKPREQAAYAAGISTSELTVHKRLLELLGHRLPNFRIEVFRNGKPQPIADYIHAGQIHLASPAEEALLQIDFDWTRRNAGKYIERTIRLRGPALIERPVIHAKLSWRRAEERYIEDISQYFQDYYAMHDSLIPPEKCFRVCKLFFREGGEDFSIEGFVSFQGRQRSFSYLNVFWDFGKADSHLG